MIVSTKAIVFSTIKYGEADLIATCFTEQTGLKTYMLRGILKAKKGALKASYFQPLMLLDLVANHKNKGTLEYIKDVKVSYPFNSLHTNIIKIGLAMFIAEMLKICIKEEETNVPLFNFIETSIIWLEEHDQIANFHIAFLLSLSRFLGFYPDDTEIEPEYFNLLEGYFETRSTGPYSINGIEVEVLKRFLGKNILETSSLKISKQERSDLLYMLLKYYNFHIQGFKMPKSLAVLNQLY